MMTIVVDDRNAVPFAGTREPALDAAEAGERLADQIVADAEIARDRDGRGRVERIVAPRHRQLELPDLVRRLAGAIAEDHRKARSSIDMVEIGRAHVELQSHLNLVCRLLLEKKKH